MVLTKEGKERILSQYLEMVSLVANKERQRRAWVLEEGPPYTIDFGETCNFFFTDYDWLMEEWTDFKINESQYQILKKFYDEFDKFSDENSEPKEFIDSPEWTQITERAKELLKAFDYKSELQNP